MPIYREKGFHYNKITEYSQINNPEIYSSCNISFL